jgi:hypothetical protein
MVTQVAKQIPRVASLVQSSALVSTNKRQKRNTRAISSAPTCDYSNVHLGRLHDRNCPCTLSQRVQCHLRWPMPTSRHRRGQRVREGVSVMKIEPHPRLFAWAPIGVSATWPKQGWVDRARAKRIGACVLKSSKARHLPVMLLTTLVSTQKRVTFDVTTFLKKCDDTFSEDRF